MNAGPYPSIMQVKPRRSWRHVLCALGVAGMMVGSAAVHAQTWTLSETFDHPAPTGGDGFGWSVAIADGAVLVGAPNDSSDGQFSGRAYLFDATSGNLLQTFQSPTPGDFARFGHSVAIDGGRALIGAPSSSSSASLPGGAAHLFDVTTGALLHTFETPVPAGEDGFGDLFGWSVAIDGDAVLVGGHESNVMGPNVGQAHLFDAGSGTLLHTFDDPSPSMADFFGFSVAMDGERALVGAPNHVDDEDLFSAIGQAHLFDAGSGALLTTFDDPTPTGSDMFGFSVAIEGGAVVISAPQADTGANRVGQVHLFDTESGTLLQTLDDPTPEIDGFFGYAVATDGELVLIGAMLDDTNGQNVGQVHVFDAATGALLQTIDDPTITTGDAFGTAVALDADALLIGARRDDTRGTDVGQAYLFARDSTPGPEPVPLPPSLVGLASGLVILGAMARRGRTARA